MVLMEAAGHKICGASDSGQNATLTTENTEESQRPQKGCSLPEKVDVFEFPHHARRTNCSSNMALSRQDSSVH